MAETAEPFAVGPGHGFVTEEMAKDRQERLLERAERLGDGIIDPDRFTPVAEPAGVSEVREMPGDGGLGKLQDRHEIADAEFLLFEKERKNAEAGLLFQRLKNKSEIFHGENISS